MNELESDAPRERRIVSSVDDAHPACSHRMQQLIASDRANRSSLFLRCLVQAVRNLIMRLDRWRVEPAELGKDGLACGASVEMLLDGSSFIRCERSLYEP